MWGNSGTATRYPWVLVPVGRPLCLSNLSDRYFGVLWKKIHPTSSPVFGWVGWAAGGRHTGQLSGCLWWRSVGEARQAKPRAGCWKLGLLVGSGGLFWGRLQATAHLGDPSRAPRPPRPPQVYAEATAALQVRSLQLKLLCAVGTVMPRVQV